jgi:hypothetical protein
LFTGRLTPPTTAATVTPPREPAAAATARDGLGVALAAATLVALPAVSLLLRNLHTGAAPSLALAADPPPPWRPALVDMHSAWQPHFSGADQQQRLAFVNISGDTVEAYTVLYHRQRQGAELIGSGSTVVGGALRLRAERPVAMAATRFRENEVAERAPPHELSLIWFRYQVAGRDFVVPLASQLWYGLNATVSQPSAGLLAFRASCRPDCEAARRRLAAFAAAPAAR